MIIIGFTGTRKGMTIQQLNQVENLLSKKIIEVHHGDCIGADMEFYSIALKKNIPICIHPPLIDKYRAFCKGAIKVYEKKEYLERNHDIVDISDILIATPFEMLEKLRSGTWATIRYALKQEKKIRIIYTNGIIMDNLTHNQSKKLNQIYYKYGGF